MTTTDFNGRGKWSESAIVRRYARYVLQEKVSPRLKIASNRSHKGDETWLYPAVEAVIDGVGAGDVACAVICIELIEEDATMPFGRTLKANAARALRQREHLLKPVHSARLRTRIFELLVKGNVPREYREYAKLLRSLGLGPYWEQLDEINPKNQHVRKWIRYFRQHAGAEPKSSEVGEVDC